MLSKMRFGGALIAAILGAVMFHGEAVAQEQQEFSLRLNIGGSKFGANSISYTTDQLTAIATATYASPRGKEVAAIPLDVLVTHDTKLSMEQILQIVVVGEKRVLLLEGENLAHAAHLLVKVGFNKATLVPDSEVGASWQAMKPLLGRPRLKHLENIFIFWQR